MAISFRVPFVCLLGACLLYAAPAWGQLWSVGQVKEQPGQFATGAATGILVHELGHVLVASSKGYDIGLEGLSIVYPNAQMSNTNRLQVASAGFQAQWLLSEAVLRPHESAHRPLNNTEAGMVCAHLGITALYLIALKEHPQSDIRGIAESTRLSTDQVALLVTVPAALDYWRLTGRHVPAWVPAISTTAKGSGIIAVWAY